jgi:hypothetical protein
MPYSADETYKAIEKSQAHWKNTFDTLMRASNVLWNESIMSMRPEECENPPLYPAYYLLIGYALEILLKRKIIILGKEVPRTHNLKKLMVSADLQFKKNECDFLEKVTDAITWTSRYPIPNKIKKYEKYVPNKKTIISHGPSFDSEDHNLAKKIIEKIDPDALKNN